MTITSSKIGTLEPTTDVLPPCGQTASLWLLQKDSIEATSLVVFGFKANLLPPTKRFFKL